MSVNHESCVDETGIYDGSVSINIFKECPNGFTSYADLDIEEHKEFKFKQAYSKTSGKILGELRSGKYDKRSFFKDCIYIFIGGVTTTKVEGTKQFKMWFKPYAKTPEKLKKKISSIEKFTYISGDNDYVVNIIQKVTTKTGAICGYLDIFAINKHSNKCHSVYSGKITLFEFKPGEDGEEFTIPVGETNNREVSPEWVV